MNASLDATPYLPPTILVCDDIPASWKHLLPALAEYGRIKPVAKREHIFQESPKADLILLDMAWGEDAQAGLAILDEIKQNNDTKDIPIVILTMTPGSAACTQARKCYPGIQILKKPSTTEGAKQLLADQLAELYLNRIRVIKLEEEKRVRRSLEEDFPGRSVATTRFRDELFTMICTLRPSHEAPLCILLQGESGSGKELTARKIARFGPYPKPFIPCNSADFGGGTSRSELFGHAKGSFTGALKYTDGVFGAAMNGTLFLDEIHRFPQESQALLNRVLDTGQIQRVGEQEASRYFRGLVLLATNVDLEKVSPEKFNDDLRRRIAGQTLRVPTLRERMEDIVDISRRLLELMSLAHDYPPIDLSPSACDKLQSHAWPGNVRELKQVLSRAWNLAVSGCAVISDSDISFEAITPCGVSVVNNSGDTEALKAPTVARTESSERAVRRNSSSKPQVTSAELLELIRQSFENRFALLARTSIPRDGSGNIIGGWFKGFLGDVDAEICERLHDAGLSYAQIGQLLGTSGQAISQRF